MTFPFLAMVDGEKVAVLTLELKNINSIATSFGGHNIKIPGMMEITMKYVNVKTGEEFNREVPYYNSLDENIEENYPEYIV